MENNREEMKVRGFRPWLDNFWYHHKWGTIGVIFAIIVALICITQMCQKDEMDMYVLYGGPESFYDGELQKNVTNAFSAVLSEDFNGDGEIKVGLVNNFIMSKEEILLDKEKRGDEDYYIDPSLMSTNKKNFENLIMAGEYSFCLVSPYMFEFLKDAGGFVLISEIFDEIPDGVYEDYGILLSETDFGRYYPGVKDLPKDTIMCVRSVGGIGALIHKGKTEEGQKQAIELIRNIVEFEAPNE